MRRPSRPLSIAITLAALMLAGCSDGTGPTLEQITPQNVSALDSLRVPLRVANPEGDLKFGLIAPEIPNLQQTYSLSGNASGGEFRWTPLSHHVGTHEFVFLLLSDGTEIDRQPTVITVEPSADSAPMFLQPSAPGRTYDLEDEPCIDFRVEVRDDDSSDVTIDTRSPLPTGATLTPRPPKQADFNWCPEPDQVATSSRWTIELSADDGEHDEPTAKDFIIRLRGETRSDCPGLPPEIQILSPSEGGTVGSEPGFPVRFSVSDDVGLRDLPVLYYTLSEPTPGPKPDLDEFEEAIVVEDGADYRGRIPNADLEDGETQPIWFFVSATDNDDESGALCDHRTDSAVVSFIAQGGSGSGLPDCDVCNSSTDCISGVCVATGGGGRCLPTCEGADTCGGGTCANRVTREGGVARTCGTVDAFCDGGSGDCTDDSFEPNDTRAAAASAPTMITDAMICPDNPDYYLVRATSGRELRVSLDGFDSFSGDLDLQLLSTSGTILDASASASGAEEVTYCADSTGDVVALVFGFRGDSNSYNMTVTEGTEACCVDDSHEGDDTRATAGPITGGNFDGIICPDDDDYYRFTVSGATLVTASIVFEDVDGDLDLELYSPSGALVDESAGTTDVEEITTTLTESGTYTLRVFGFRGAGGPYVGELTQGATTGCTSTSGCPVGQVCQGSSCVPASCTSSSSCPSRHGCPAGGPTGAMRECGAECTFNSDCRSGESCKRFPEGRFCLERGSGLNGDACSDYSQCGGQRACMPYPGGYCARAGCTRNSDCETGTRCIEEAGVNVCMVECPGTSCRSGYSCELRSDIDLVLRGVCAP